MKTVYHRSKGEGKLIEDQGLWSLVDFGNGEERVVSVTLKSKPIIKKVKAYMKDEVKEHVETFNSIVNNLKGSREDRGSMFAFGDSIYNKLEKLADSKGHFAASIIEDARNGKFISDKQACVVAYFAKSNGLIK